MNNIESLDKAQKDLETEIAKLHETNLQFKSNLYELNALAEQVRQIVEAVKNRREE